MNDNGKIVLEHEQIDLEDEAANNESNLKRSFYRAMAGRGSEISLYMFFELPLLSMRGKLT